MRRAALAAVAAAVLAVPAARAAPPSFVLTSSAFHDGGRIPKRYTCDGDDVSPPLRWTRPPHGTRGLALEVTDTDAVDQDLPVFFVHWTAWGMPPRAGSLAAGARPPLEGRTSFGVVGYGGPCPPHGQKAHHYVFQLYALRVAPRLRAGAPWIDFRTRVLRHHVLAIADVTGLYARP